MASTPRVSGLYNYNENGEYFNEYSPEDDGRTPLDKTIDKIGMGTYQWVLLSLCGFGWLADNMWLQTVSIILPRVQRHYDISDSNIGLLSASVFAGMMIGAVVWGTCSDLLGRITAFNCTLLLTAVFGIVASVSSSFLTLCLSMFFLGSAVGGSMPTDGTLLLEHMPRGKQYLVTALSVFFSFGAVISALVAILVVPSHSCHATSLSAECNPDLDNRGWQYLLQILAGITLFMFLCRIVFFRLYESPRYLVHAGRPQEAILSLQKISKFNGEEMVLHLEDVLDSGNGTDNDPSCAAPTEEIDDLKVQGLASLSNDPVDYHSVSESPTPPDFPSSYTSGAINHASGEDVLPDSSISSISAVRRGNVHSTSALPRLISRPINAWVDRMRLVLCPEWRRTTLLVWAAWWSMSLAYTMFNVYLPKLLESRKSEPSPEQNLVDTMWDIVIFTMGGCPGALLGAYLQELRLGRRLSLAMSTLATALCCWLFVLVHSPWAVRATTVGISLSATTMWAILYGWTPAIFSTAIRGTACGSASALSRVGGIMAPLIGGALLVVNPALPVYASIGVFGFATLCVLGLTENESSSNDGYQSLPH